MFHVKHTPTICALASGAPPSALCIIRISGPKVRGVIKEYLKPNTLTPRVAGLRKLIDVSGETIDEGLALFIPGPNSFTGEDVLELTLHGGRAIIEDALESLTSFPDIRLAEPGEYTRLAFENDRLDLTQAEGIADLIDAESRAQRRQALRQTDGLLSETYGRWRHSLLRLIGGLEARIDFPDEEDVPENVADEWERDLKALAKNIRDALGDNEVGQRIRDGFRVAIIGPPNVGKSTLLNALARRDAAIVTDIPGTTRDVVEIRCLIGGHIVWVADTAGLRETQNPIEAEGIHRAEMVGKAADLRLFVCDASVPHRSTPETVTRCAHDLIIWNKTDLIDRLPSDEGIALSAKTGFGIQDIETAIARWIEEETGRNEAPVITRTRHRQGLSDGLAHIQRAYNAWKSSLDVELVAEDLRMAARSLGALIGEIGVEDVLGEVFSNFCIGK